ncbi:MAG: ribulose-phosphate 3-epimerase, partial [Acidobacteria bacterium ACB2]|nr:ribulose-phosphate 3-epimerase [Acidobacteria bacterium ACB2]
VGVGNAAALAAAGARFLVAGSAVFGTGDVPRAIEDLRAAAGSLP